jgi:hypothetical protein
MRCRGRLVASAHFVAALLSLFVRQQGPDTEYETSPYRFCRIDFDAYRFYHAPSESISRSKREHSFHILSGCRAFAAHHRGRPRKPSEGEGLSGDDGIMRALRPG